MMFSRRRSGTALAIVLAILAVTGSVVAVRLSEHVRRTNVVAYFDNSTGVFVGDDVRILGVAVGQIAAIDVEPTRVKISFWFDAKYSVPADAKAVILSPSLVSARAIQLTPAYTSGAELADEAVIPQQRTAVPVEWDDFREQLQKLTQSLQPTQPGGVSSFGAFVNTAADNLRGQGTNIHDAIVKLSQVFSTLGDHSTDLFGTLKSLSQLVNGLQTSRDLLTKLNQNLASVTALLANDPDEVAHAVRDLDAAVGDVGSFVAENRDALGIATDRLASVSTALTQSIGDVKQVLHVAPSSAANFTNSWSPATNALTGVLVLDQLANPVNFICGAIQAASRLNFEQSAKLCAQYLAPIVKNRQYNFPPLGMNPVVGVRARPNEVTYSEDRLRPDYVPPQAPPTPPPPDVEPLPAEAATPTDPGTGLPGLMIPAGAGR